MRFCSSALFTVFVCSKFNEVTLSLHYIIEFLSNFKDFSRIFLQNTILFDWFGKMSIILVLWDIYWEKLYKLHTYFYDLFIKLSMQSIVVVWSASRQIQC